ncbi:MAG TPA: S-layer homology domain-containing protein [Acidimicrobiales bacterium]|nr:S-layer homology domain-containing protein [Acidimicrobiales bacterium]
MVGLAASALAPASAQTADPPAATPTDAFCANVPDAYQPFDDVSDADTFAETIRCLAYARITTGVEPGRFAPGELVSRGQMASFLARLLDTANDLELGSDDPDDQLVDLLAYDGTNDFTDVADDGAHVAAINRIADAGIALGGPGGLPATSYGPGQPVSRDQMASFVTRSLEYLSGVERATEADYFDDDDTNVHEDNINALAEVGIAVGVGPATFAPDGNVTRGQMSAFIMRSLANFEIADRIAPLPERSVPSDPFSTSASVDNGNGTATISFTVRDAQNRGIDDLEASEFSLVVPGQTEPSGLDDLIENFPGVWGPFTDAEAGNGVYTVVLRSDPGTYTYTDITVRGVEIDPSLEVTITGS